MYKQNPRGRYVGQEDGGSGPTYYLCLSSPLEDLQSSPPHPARRFVRAQRRTQKRNRSKLAAKHKHWRQNPTGGRTPGASASSHRRPPSALSFPSSQPVVPVVIFVGRRGQGRGRGGASGAGGGKRGGRRCRRLPISAAPGRPRPDGVALGRRGGHNDGRRRYSKGSREGTVVADVVVWRP